MAKSLPLSSTLAPRSVQESATFAAHRIRAAIIAGQFKPGDRLIEMDLAERLAVSRHPIRQALRELEREGLVTIRPNRGAVAAELDARDIFEVYEIRATLGSLALRHLLRGDRRMSTRQLARLERLARDTLAHARGEQARMVACDLAFQAEVVQASGLVRAAAYFRSLGAEIQRFINVLGIAYPDREATARREVLGLFQAIRDGDHPRAERIWQEKFAAAARCLAALVPGGEAGPMGTGASAGGGTTTRTDCAQPETPVGSSRSGPAARTQAALRGARVRPGVTSYSAVGNIGVTGRR